MTGPISDDVATLTRRVGDLIDQVAAGDDTRRIADEALAELAVAIEEMQAQNIELAASRELLEAERERYRALFHAVRDGFLVTTVAGVIVEANQTAADLLGRSIVEVLGRPLATFVVDDDHQAFEQHLRRLGSSDTGVHLTVNLSFNEHVTFPANLRATVVNAHRGGEPEIRWLLHDRRNELETEELLANEGRLRALFDMAAVGILLCDVDGSIVFGNHHADQLLERRRDRAGADDWMAAVQDDDRAPLQEMMVAVGRGADASSLRYRVTTGSGLTRWVDQTTTPLLGRVDEIEGSVSTLIDSTAEVEAATNLRQSRDFADGLLDTAGALVVVIGRDTRIVRFNKACENATGWRSEEAIGRPVVDFLVPVEQRISVDGLMSDMLSSPSSTSMENDWIAKDGRRVRIRWHNAAVIDASGVAVAIVCTGVDITRQRLLESRLAQTDRLESVGRLASGIAHDFNNTLAVLRLRIERLPVNDQAQRENVEALTRTIEHSKTTIANLLSFSRHQDLVVEPTDVNAELRRHVAMLHDLVGDDIELVIELTNDDSTTLFDPARFEQIIVNLAINARDAMGEGGTLTLRTDIIEREDTNGIDRAVWGALPATLPSGSYLCVSVADTGAGIRPDDLTHVFDPYFTTKPPGRGTGLGLATAYGTVTQSGGEIVVDSELGVGTTFTLWLPLYRPAEVRAAAAVATDVGSRSAVVLIVDDDDDLREVLADELVLLGCDTIEAHDGVAGLEQIHRNIDLLVTDIQMPRLDGLDLARAFSEASPDTPVLFVTGLTPKELRDRLPPEAHVLRKPFSAAEFRTAVNGLLGQI